MLPPAWSRIIYTAMSLALTLTLGLLIGSRLVNIDQKWFSDLTFTRALIFVLYFSSVTFVFSSALLVDGLDFTKFHNCSGAVYVCVGFYFMCTGMKQLFLTERAHAVRAHRASRLRDPLWITGVTVIVLCLGCLFIFAMIFRIAEVTEDGICEVGLPIPVITALLIYDILVNSALTTVFVCLLRPLLKVGLRVGQAANERPKSVRLLGSLGPVSHWIAPGLVKTLDAGIDANGTPKNTVAGQQWKVYRLVWKSLIGSVLIFIPTVVNLCLFYRMHAHELGWFCFMLCTLDVVWSVCVLHWLTVDPEEQPPPSRGSLRSNVVV